MFEILEASMRRRRAFVLDMGANGLGTSRSLGKCGIDVTGLDFVRKAPGFVSRHVDPLLCPNPMADPDQLLELLMREGSELNEKGILYPCSDAFLGFVSKNRKELTNHYELTIPREEVVNGLIDKRYQYEWAVKLGIPVPKAFFFSSLQEMKERRGEIEFPSLVKPLVSHLWSVKVGNKGFIVRDQRELEERFVKAQEEDLDAMVQKVVMPPGENIRGCAGYFGRNGYVSPVFTWEKTRQDPPNFGVGSCVRSRNFADVAELGRKFAVGIGFIGSGSLNFKLDLDDGLWKLIEMNGRLWMQNCHAAACGLNFPLLQYLDSQALALPNFNGFKEGVVWWDSLSDFRTFIRLHRQGRISTRGWISSWFLPDVNAYFESDDLRPALVRHGYGSEIFKTIGSLLKMREDQDAIRSILEK